MGTLRRDVTRAWSAIKTTVSKLFGKPRTQVPVTPAKKKADFNLAKFDPGWDLSYFNRYRYAEGWARAWFDEFFLFDARTRLGRKTLQRPMCEDTLLHYIHRGHRHAAKRRRKTRPNPFKRHTAV